MSDKSPLIVTIGSKVDEWTYQIVENSVTSILFKMEDATTQCRYNIRMRAMSEQSETTVEGIKNRALREECVQPVQNLTGSNQVLKLKEKYRGHILLVDFFKNEEILVRCATCVLLVKPVKLKIAQVVFRDSAGNEIGCSSVQYEADLKFSLRVLYNRPLLRGEKASKLKCKGYCTHPVTGEYEEIFKFQQDENTAYTDTLYCNDGLQESHAGADYVLSLGFTSPYDPPFYKENTKTLVASIQKIHLISRSKPRITSVVWSSKEMIRFGENSPKRKSIFRNEDGFLHIHTRGMYGQKVRVELFEKDSTGTKKLLLGLKDEVIILDNVVCVPVEMKGVYAKAKQGRLSLFEGSSFEIMAKVTPLDTSIATFEQGDESIIELKVDGEADKAAKSTVNGTMKFVIADVEEDDDNKKHTDKCPRCKETASDMQKRIKQCFPKANDDTIKQIAEAYCKYMNELKMNTCWIKAHFFAQIAIETGMDLEPKAESMNYSIKALKTIFNDRFTEEERKKYGRGDLHKADQKMIAKIAYGGRYGNGDRDTDDGWNYRGKGLIQLTFKSNYEKVRSRIMAKGLGDIIQNPDLLVTNYEVATYASMLYLCDRGITKSQVANGQKQTLYVSKSVGNQHVRGTSTNYKDKQAFFDNHSSIAFEILKCDWKAEGDKSNNIERAPWMKIALSEAKEYGGGKEGEEPLKTRIKTKYYPAANMSTSCDPTKNENAWCACFASFILKESGTIKQGSASSQFFKNKEFRKTEEPTYGAIVVYTNKNGRGGHVAFLYGMTEQGDYIVLGGNQSDTIKFMKKNTSKSQILTGFYLPSQYQDNPKDILSATEKKLVVEDLNNSKLKTSNNDENSKTI